MARSGGPTPAEPPPSRPYGERLAGWDAATWRMASGDPTLRAPIGAIVLLDRPPDVDRLVERVERMSRWFPVLRQRLIEPAVPLTQPRLVIDPHFDARVHMTRIRLPRPGRWRQLVQFARRQSLLDLDRDRPLWRATLVEGLEGDKAALVIVVHHAVADGQGMVTLVAGLFDWSDDTAASTEPMPPVPEPGRTDPFSVTIASIASAAKMAGGLGKTAVTSVPSVARAMLRPDKVVSGAAVMGASVVKAAAVHRAPLSPLMRERSTTYTISTLDVAFRELRAVAKSYSATVNDVFMAAVAGGLRLYHERHGVAVAELRFNMPMSLRRRGQEANNAVTVARFEVPVGDPNPDSRIAEIRARVDKVRGEPALYFADVLAEASRLLPVQVIAETAKTSDVTASNVPGPRAPVWVSGARVLRVYPLVSTIGAAVNITMLSYAREVASMCVATDDAAIPDPDVFMECLAEGFAEVGAPPLEASANPLAVE